MPEEMLKPSVVDLHESISDYGLCAKGEPKFVDAAFGGDASNLREGMKYRTSNLIKNNT